MYSVGSSLGSKCYALDAWHNDLLRGPLLEQTDGIMKIMYDEMAFAIDAYLDVTRNEWKEASVDDFVRDIVSRTSSRFIVGLPLCRDEAYLGAARESISVYMLDTTRHNISKLRRADSLARETMRLRNYGSRITFRKVMATQGITTPLLDEHMQQGRNGVVLPWGTAVSWFSMPAQRDEDAYEEAEKFNPFRFEWKLEALSTDSAKQNLGDGGGKVELAKFSTTSMQHLGFGHGSHACPGRFLADGQLKMLMAYLVVNYDLRFPEEYAGVRPANLWIAEGQMPPAAARFRVRRRLKTAS